jgi:hypothetical protein
MRPDYAENVEHWELDRLIVILLRQFRRVLADHGVELQDSTIRAIGGNPTQAPDDLKAALVAAIAESETVLAQWHLDFATSLKTDMDALEWTTTADFLALANEKINAEVRISAGSSLLLLLGDRRHADYLLQAIDHDLNTQGRLDVDAMIARRALLHATNVDPNAADWLDQVRAWVRDK